MDIIMCHESFDLNGLTEKYRQMYPSSEYTNTYILSHEKYIIVKKNPDSKSVAFLGKYGRFYNNIYHVVFFHKKALDGMESSGELDDIIDDNTVIMELTESQNKDIRTIINMYYEGLINGQNNNT